jgi:hypothetical protein
MRPQQSRSKGEQQGGAVVGLDVERACLGVAQPAFRYQFIEERMEAGLAYAVRLASVKAIAGCLASK